MKFALGELGWTPYQYWTSSPYEFHAACEGYLVKERKQAELLRQIGYNIWMGGRTKKDQKVFVEDWLPLSTDVSDNKKRWQPNKEEYDRLMSKTLNVKVKGNGGRNTVQGKHRGR